MGCAGSTTAAESAGVDDFASPVNGAAVHYGGGAVVEIDEGDVPATRKVGVLEDGEADRINGLIRSKVNELPKHTSSQPKKGVALSEGEAAHINARLRAQHAGTFKETRFKVRKSDEGNGQEASTVYQGEISELEPIRTDSRGAGFYLPDIMHKGLMAIGGKPPQTSIQRHDRQPMAPATRSPQARSPRLPEQLDRTVHEEVFSRDRETLEKHERKARKEAAAALADEAAANSVGSVVVHEEEALAAFGLASSSLEGDAETADSKGEALQSELHGHASGSILLPELVEQVSYRLKEGISQMLTGGATANGDALSPSPLAAPTSGPYGMVQDSPPSGQLSSGGGLDDVALVASTDTLPVGEVPFQSRRRLPGDIADATDAKTGVPGEMIRRNVVARQWDPTAVYAEQRVAVSTSVTGDKRYHL